MQPTLSDIKSLTLKAGGIIRQGYEQKHEVSYKGVIDIVTEVDRQSEAFLIGEIKRLFPGHQIVSEEAGLLPGAEIDQWYIDPLDGTVNYAHGIPFFSVSIAYARAGVLCLGAVYDPIRDELFTGELGKGASMNGNRIHPSATNDLQKSLLVTGFPYDTWSSEHNNLDNFARFAKLTQGVRRLGSAALDLSYVAAGRFDGYWEFGLQPWDVAAGSLIASEAGATVTGADGLPVSLIPPCTRLAAPIILHSKMLEILKDQM
jgi:myo-inositol-1(or 4)-monophosphatase